MVPSLLLGLKKQNAVHVRSLTICDVRPIPRGLRGLDKVIDGLLDKPPRRACIDHGYMYESTGCILEMLIPDTLREFRLVGPLVHVSVSLWLARSNNLSAGGLQRGACTPRTSASFTGHRDEFHSFLSTRLCTTSVLPIKLR